MLMLARDKGLTFAASNTTTLPLFSFIHSLPIIKYDCLHPSAFESTRTKLVIQLELQTHAISGPGAGVDGSTSLHYSAASCLTPAKTPGGAVNTCWKWTRYYTTSKWDLYAGKNVQGAPSPPQVVNYWDHRNYNGFEWNLEKNIFSFLWDWNFTGKSKSIRINTIFWPILPNHYENWGFPGFLDPLYVKSTI